MIRPAAAVAMLAVAPGAVAAAERYQCGVLPSSTYTQNTLVQIPMSGTWIGDFDAATNPAGTRTRLGLFGGSGNVPIPFSATLKPSIAITDAQPGGAFEFTFDRSTGAVSVAGLQLDFLDGQAGSLSTSMLLTYSAFNTQQPTSIFPALTNVQVPLDSGTLTEAAAAQSGTAIGAAVASGAGSWTFSVGVPVDVTAAGTALGQPFATTSQGVLVLAGSFSIKGNVLTMSTQGSVNETVAVPPPPPLVAAPFDLPTVLPAGQVAHLLISATFAAGTSTTTGSTSLQVSGSRVLGTGDINGDGSVNGADLAELLTGWGLPGPTDLNASGSTDGADIVLLLVNWS